MSFRQAFALIALVAASWLPSAHADTFVQLNHQTTSGTVDGRRVTPADGPWTVSFPFPATSKVFTVQVWPSNGASPVYMNFEAPDHAPLAVGTYTHAQAYPFQAAGHAGLAPELGCNFGHGGFTVHELAVAGDGSITSFAADFEFHCGDSVLATYGGVRFNSSVPYADFATEPIPAVTAQFFSELGDYIGGGRAWTVTDNTGRIAGGALQGRVSFSYGGPYPDNFGAEFGGPNGTPLSPGTYENAGSGSPGYAYIDVSTGTNGCQPAASRMVVHEIEIDEDGVLRKLAIDFEQHCYSSASKALFGAIRYNSSVPPIADPRTDVRVATSISVPNNTTTYMVRFGEGETLLAYTNDAQGRFAPYQPVRASATCGTFVNNGQQSLAVTSDGNGIASIGAWIAPATEGTCTITLTLDVSPYPSVTIAMTVFPVGADRFGALAGDTYQIQYGTTNRIGPSFRTLDRIGTGWNSPLRATASCGSFGGQATVDFSSIFSGDVVLPEWTAPTDRAITRCDVVVELLAFAHPQVTMHLNLVEAPPPPPLVNFYFSSQPGEKFLGGASETVTNSDGKARGAVWSDGTIATDYNPSQITPMWGVFLSPAAAPMVPGTYQVNGSSRPAIQVMHYLTGCASHTGKFVVLEVQFSGATLVKFAADVEEHCEGAAPALYIGIRYNSTIPYSQIAPPPPLAATRLAYYLPAHDYDTEAGRTLSGFQVSTLDDSGTKVGGETVRYVASCGSFANGTNTADAVSDMYGTAQPPDWTAPGTGTTCTVTATLQRGTNPSLMFGITVRPPTTGATNLALVGELITSYNVYVGFPLMGRQVRTLGSSGNPLAGQAVHVAATCGVFSNGMSTADLVSDSTGTVTLPTWTAPSMAGTCRIEVSLPGAPAAGQISFTVTVLPPNATRLVYLDSTLMFIIAGDTDLNGIRAATVDASNMRVSGQRIQVHASCGTFGGQSTIEVMSDSSGIVNLPTYHSPASNGTDCTLTLLLLGGMTGAIQFTVHVVSPAPPPPEVVTSRSGQTPVGLATLSILSPLSTCTLSHAMFFDQSIFSPPMSTPGGLSMPNGWIDFTVDNCVVGEQTLFIVEYPQPLPPTAQWWKNGPTPDNARAHWYTIPSTVDGNKISFAITDGGIGDDDLTRNGSITDFGGIAIPGGTYQDLWWGGSIENGWGMSIVQHRDTLFANLYVYDASGNPVWYVMPSGTWNGAHTAFTGALYLPTGSPFYAYDVSRFNVGASVGTMTLTFTDVNNAVFDYTIDGVTARKNITRVLYGPNAAPTDQPHGDLWWAGSAQNGWGLAVLQQYQTLFALWFTYDANGKAVWYVMPGGDWAVKDDYRGAVYKAAGPPWLGVPYDASRHHVTNAGTFDLIFSGADNATFNYSVEGKTGSIPLTRIPF